MDMKKNNSGGLLALILIGLTIIVFGLSLLVLFSTNSTGKSNPYAIPIVLVYFVAIFIVIKKFNNRERDIEAQEKKKFSEGKQDSDSTSAGNAPVRSSGKKAEDSEKIINMFCPNCGAPLTIGSKIICDYCHTQFTSLKALSRIQNNRNVIPPEEYNPLRYYEENDTGYHIKNGENKK